jgi:hypothetical protein
MSRFVLLISGAAGRVSGRLRDQQEVTSRTGLGADEHRQVQGLMVFGSF